MKLSWRLFAFLLLGLVVLASVASAATGDEDIMRGAMGDDDDEDDDTEGSSGPGSAADDAGASAKPDEPAVIDPKGKEKESGYDAPDAPEAIFVETFQDGFGRWTYSEAAQYSGRFAVGQGAKPAFPGDRALIIPLKARHYAATAPVIVDDLDKKDFVLQYEVRLDDGMSCGGAYLKLPTDGDRGFKGGAAFNADVAYSVMFGPDRCGSTDKVHFIIQSRHPETGIMSEHHFKNPPSVVGVYDKKTHLYGVAVKADGTVEISVDGEVKANGSLSEDFMPPIQPAKEIDDIKDKKPDDWVDEKQIPDPEAVKPDDWDDDAPLQIPDEDATMPDDWLVDEPKKVPDPKATKPEEWDEEEDGKWEPPLISNPKCQNNGCGEWKRPMVANPAYKGKWKAPLIDNPKYIGEWAPRKILNPDFYVVEKPSLLPIRAVGFEIWTMDQGVVFDNIYIGHDISGAKKFADATYGKKKVTEEKVEKATRKESEKSDKSSSVASATSKTIQRFESVLSAVEAGLAPLEHVLSKIGAEPVLDKLIDIGVNKPLITVVTIPIMIVTFMLLLMSGGGKKGDETREAEDKPDVADKKKSDAVSPDDDADSDDKIEEVTSSVRDDQTTAVRNRRTATAE